MENITFGEADEEVRRAYLQDPTVCPYCGSPDIDLSPQFGLTNIVECQDCHKRWAEILSVTDILEEK